VTTTLVQRTVPRRRAAAIAAEALVVTYPLVLMSLTRQRLTTTAAAGVLAAPVNQFAHTPEFVESPFAPVIAPNVDTLTSSAWLDLSREPLCLTVPDTAGRYHAMTLYDAWTTPFATIGSRTTGTREREFLLVGPRWRGALPRSLPVVQSPTSSAWILGHIRSDGPEDHPAVRRLQAVMRLTPLSRRGMPPAQRRPAVDPRDVPASSPAARLARMEVPEYFGTVARLLGDNPPHPADRLRIERMSALGVVPGQAPSWSLADRPLLREIARGMTEGLAQVEAAGAAMSSPSTPWALPQDVGRRRADPLLRAAAAWTALGAWPRRDALFFTTGLDEDGVPLVGTERYTLRFRPGAEPPVHAFWSLTPYGDTGVGLGGSVRAALGDRDAPPHAPDGSLVVLLQHDRPDQEAGWLRTPPGPFTLALRLYWPRPPALNGTWQPPPVQRR